MSIVKNEFKSAVLWHMNGQAIATFYEAENEDQQKKTLIDTIWFTGKAYLAFRRLHSLRIPPPAVHNLGSLSSLLLQNNNLQTIPKEVWQLTHLQELNLGCNQLKTLPKEIGLLIHLQELYLHSNQLVHIPSQVGCLQQLQILDLTDNRLGSLPGEVASRMHLKNLWVSKNPFSVQATQQLDMISLKDRCAQTIGLWCLADPDSRDVILDLPDSNILDKSLVVPENVDLVPLCQSCQGRLFHYGLRLVSVDGDIPFVYYTCSQNCYIQLHNNLINKQ